MVKSGKLIVWKQKKWFEWLCMNETGKQRLVLSGKRTVWRDNWFGQAVKHWSGWGKRMVNNGKQMAMEGLSGSDYKETKENCCAWEVYGAH